MATKQKRNNDDFYMDSYVNAVKDLIKMDDLSDDDKTDILSSLNEHDSDTGAKGEAENVDDASPNDANHASKNQTSSAQKSAPAKAKPDKSKDKSVKSKDKPDKVKSNLAKGKFSSPSKSKSFKVSTPIGEDDALSPLWQAAAVSKARKPKETQVWLDNALYRKIEMLNIKHGKPVPTKHLINAMLKIFLNEHKAEVGNTNK